MGDEGARSPGLHRVGLLHSHLVLLASQEITIQQCMFPRGLCIQEPRINMQKSCLLLAHHTGLAESTAHQQ